jgi:hypothetical protein
LVVYKRTGGALSHHASISVRSLPPEQGIPSTK